MIAVISAHISTRRDDGSPPEHQKGKKRLLT
jgi:hypothetical protein